MWLKDLRKRDVLSRRRKLKTRITECAMATSSREQMLLQKTNEVRQNTDGLAELAVIVITMNKVGDAWARRRRESNMVEQFSTAHEAP